MNLKRGDVTKLPKWAQEHIYTLHRQISNLEDAVQELQGQQEDSCIYYYAQNKNGHPDIRVNVPSSSIEVDAFGVELRVVVPYDGPEIRVSWSSSRGYPNLLLPMLEPRSSNMIYISNPVYVAQRYEMVGKQLREQLAM